MYRQPAFLPYVNELQNDNGLPLFTCMAVALLLNHQQQERAILQLYREHKDEFNLGIDFVVAGEKIWFNCHGVVHLLGLICQYLHWPEAMLILSLLNANQELTLEMAVKFPQQSVLLLDAMQTERHEIHRTIVGMSQMVAAH